MSSARAIDGFTDSHPEVRASRAVLVPEFGHYARIISDVFFDHFLIRDWSRFASGTPEEFVSFVFRTIDAYDGELPDRLANVYPRMREGDWLLSYGDVAGIHEALQHLSFRLSRRPHLELAARYLTGSRAELENHFRRFFPEVMVFAARVNAAGGKRTAGV